VSETESKEMADLRKELEAQRRENDTLMKQFQEASETIRVLNDANKLYKDKNSELTTELTL
jgi:cell division protein FtsL